MIDNDELFERAKRIVVEFIEATNRKDRERVAELSVLGACPVKVVDGYLQTLFLHAPLGRPEFRLLDIDRDRFGPKWARWVKHDVVSLEVRFDSALGQQLRTVDVWLYGVRGNLGGQLASRLAEKAPG